MLASTVALAGTHERTSGNCWYGRTDGQANEGTSERANGRANERTSEKANERTRERANEGTRERASERAKRAAAILFELRCDAAECGRDAILVFNISPSAQ